MRLRMIALIGAVALSASACGSTGGKSPAVSRAANPVNLTVYVNDSRVSVSPQAVGAGPVVFIVTNQASTSQALAISRPGADHPLASTAPINPQGTTQVAVNFRPGNYTIGIAPQGTDAALSVTPPIRSALIHIGQPRPNSSNTLLQP